MKKKYVLQERMVLRIALSVFREQRHLLPLPVTKQIHVHHATEKKQALQKP